MVTAGWDMADRLADQGRLVELAARTRSELEGDLMPFWLEHAADGEGLTAYLSNDLVPDHRASRGLVLHARYLWTFSALYQAYGQAQWLGLAGRALDYLQRHFWDAQYGGYLWELDADGRCLDGHKKIYGQAFGIYALAQFYQATGRKEALDTVRSIWDLIETHSHDPLHGGYVEVCNRDWAIAAGCRLSEKDQVEPKSMNTHLHLLEAYTGLYRIWRDDAVRSRLEGLIDIFTDRIYNPKTGHLDHFFDLCWQRRSDNYTFGHEIEASWLLWDAVDTIGDPNRAASLRPFVIQLADSVLQQGLDRELGGLYYEGRAGTITDPSRQWWPQAEAVVGFLNAYMLTGRDAFLDAAYSVWSFIERHLVDRRYGEWFWQTDGQGRPDHGMPKVCAWKGPYHTVRCCLEVIRRIDDMEGWQ